MGQTVREVMLARPKTLPADATVADLRALFENPRVATALLVDGTAFVGAIDRDQVDGALAGTVPARSLVEPGAATISPEAPVAEAMARLDAAAASRLVVVGPDGVTLQGLVCLNARRDGFCR